MSPDKEKELIDIYPDLFSGLDERSCMHLFGFECHDGWFELLKKLIHQIKEICESAQFKDSLVINDVPMGVKVEQVKEKFGTLRFYTNFHNECVEKLIDEACAASEVTCEKCGEAGTLGAKGYWISVRCPACK